MLHENKRVHFCNKILIIYEVCKKNNHILFKQGTAPKSYDVLCGKETFSERKWRYELGHFVKLLVSPGNEKLPHCLSQPKKLQSIVKIFMERILTGPKEIIYESILGLCLLAQHNLASAFGNFDEDLTKHIFDKYSMDNFLQAATNHLLNKYESLTSLEVEGEPFVYPPFQKALPYFPDYGYQVTLVFKDGELSTNIMRAIINIIQKLKGVSQLVYHCRNL